MQQHLVHIHRDRGFLLDAVVEYFEAGRKAGDAGIVIARPALRAKLGERIPGLRMLDAERTLARIMVGDMPDWSRFLDGIGGLIAQVRAGHSGVRAYGEMVDLLWQAGNEDGAVRLEQFWNELARLHDFSLFCAYHLDCLERGDAVQRISRLHTHLVPGRDAARLDGAVKRAAQEVLVAPLSEILLSSLATAHHRGAQMPAGQAALLWLERNMPRSAALVRERVRQAIGTAA